MLAMGSTRSFGCLLWRPAATTSKRQTGFSHSPAAKARGFRTCRTERALPPASPGRPQHRIADAIAGSPRASRPCSRGTVLELRCRRRARSHDARRDRRCGSAGAQSTPAALYWISVRSERAGGRDDVAGDRGAVRDPAIVGREEQLAGTLADLSRRKPEELALGI